MRKNVVAPLAGARSHREIQTGLTIIWKELAVCHIYTLASIHALR
jgi:hypothetical protein